MKRSGFKQKARKSMKKTRKPSQSKCDSMLSPIIAKLYPKCLLCGKDTQVAHHYVHKSKSLALRYDFENLIPLCNSCHFMLHHNESYWGGKVRDIKGDKWFAYIESKKPIITRYLDYEEVFNRLKSL